MSAGHCAASSSGAVVKDFPSQQGSTGLAAVNGGEYHHAGYGDSYHGLTTAAVLNGYHLAPRQVPYHSTRPPSTTPTAVGASLPPDCPRHDRQVHEVWAWNLEEEFDSLQACAAEEGTILALDTEFPGFLREESQGAEYAERYQVLRENVNSLRPIQLAVAVADTDDTLRGVWSFNLFFDLAVDRHTEASVQFLRDAGLDFARHASEGIDASELGRRLACSTLFGQTGCVPLWVAFSGAYDLGFLLKLVTAGRRLPKSADDFGEAVLALCPRRHELRDQLPKGSLDSLAKIHRVQRHGTAHTAGSDALLTLELYINVVRGMWNWQQSNWADGRYAASPWGHAEWDPQSGGYKDSTGCWHPPMADVAAGETASCRTALATNGSWAWTDQWIASSGSGAWMPSGYPSGRVDGRGSWAGWASADGQRPRLEARRVERSVPPELPAFLLSQAARRRDSSGTPSQATPSASESPREPEGDRGDAREDVLSQSEDETATDCGDDGSQDRPLEVDEYDDEPPKDVSHFGRRQRRARVRRDPARQLAASTHSSRPSLTPMALFCLLSVLSTVLYPPMLVSGVVLLLGLAASTGMVSCVRQHGWMAWYEEYAVSMANARPLVSACLIGCAVRVSIVLLWSLKDRH